jgi:hypothetical protein
MITFYNFGWIYGIYILLVLLGIYLIIIIYLSFDEEGYTSIPFKRESKESRLRRRIVPIEQCTTS